MFLWTRTGDVKTRPRRAETRAGSRHPKKTHARTGAKHLLGGRRPENAKTCLWRPPEYFYIGSARRATEIKKYRCFERSRISDERAKKNKKDMKSVSEEADEETHKKSMPVRLKGMPVMIFFL